ncbi:hypothetical protein E2C01_067596 [Portunus trituberculatus]|uniref:Uncharacterized protein n=1 Tax=Portunus trituberculatus TaxID=210409 RepID=A0A5B7HT27_PORTR|nr:hypothetical protein [Portunus trituberculatus]
MKGKWFSSKQYTTSPENIRGHLECKQMTTGGVMHGTPGCAPSINLSTARDGTLFGLCCRLQPRQSALYGGPGRRSGPWV